MQYVLIDILVVEKGKKEKKKKKKDSLNKVKMIEKKIVLLMEKCRSTKGKEIRNCEIS
jgi:hypothetical protein